MVLYWCCYWFQCANDVNLINIYILVYLYIYIYTYMSLFCKKKKNLVKLTELVDLKLLENNVHDSLFDNVKYIWLKSHLLLSYFSLLACCDAGDLKTRHYRSHASDPMTWIFNMINTGHDLFSANQITCGKTKQLSIKIMTLS